MVSNSKLSHLDHQGRAKMVDIGDKNVSKRVAVSRGVLQMQPETLQIMLQGNAPKGDVLSVARVAAIQAAKRTHELIPLCHILALTSCHVDFRTDPQTCSLTIEAKVTAIDRTGAEMEALMAVSIAALTVYDMLKAVDKSMLIKEIGLYEKRGGKSGDYKRDESL